MFIKASDFYTPFIWKGNMFSLYNKLLGFFLILFILSYLLNSWSVVPYNFFPIDAPETGYSLRINHILFITFFFWLMLKCHTLPKKMLLPSLLIFLLIIYSCLLYFFWWQNYYIINYFWALLCFLCAGLLSRRQFNLYQIRKIFIIVTILFYFFVFVKNILFYSEFFIFFSNPLVHPNVPSLIGGGLNIESTMLSMMTLFFYKYKKIFNFFILMSLVIAIFYSSRVGVISSFLVLALVNYHYQKNKMKYIGFLFCLLLLILFFFYLLFINDSYIVERFSRVGDLEEAGSSGRLNMWRWIFPTLSENILGFGAGNSINAISHTANTIFLDNNIHLYPMQVFLDFGFLGIIFYLYVFYFFTKKVLTTKNDSFVFYGFIFIYLLLGFIQFKGGETLVYLIAGFAVCYDNGADSD